jgi:hypothetical protein
MLLRKRTLFAIAFAGTSVVSGPSTARAADPGLPLTIKPLQGASFEADLRKPALSLSYKFLTRVIWIGAIRASGSERMSVMIYDELVLVVTFGLSGRC